MLCGSPFLLALLHVHELPGIFWHTARGWPSARGSGGVVSAGGLEHTTLLPALAMMGHGLKFSEAAARFQIIGPLFPRFFVPASISRQLPSLFFRRKIHFFCSLLILSWQKARMAFHFFATKSRDGFFLEFLSMSYLVPSKISFPPRRSSFSEGKCHQAWPSVLLF